ncbi:hypothetical protein ETAA8_56210 [Anatilimnocola aggregata]|uniref:Uncharacterized protein n=1 Tax=Anatilimnocola aggregata TaxID=2528021 RepID=A0A517YJS8_9BACT|nr:hypothetical protein [Anatilimnocola aggregata]QDU30481.1 hypothetical protein ETAA8_56210 [Anatilimnocola aggregata]
MVDSNQPPRNRAIAILTEAREILAERLTERVLDSAEEILSDARGESYMNDIDAVYEQVGVKLSHITQMLANMPAEEVQPATNQFRTDDVGPQDYSVVAEEGTSHDLVATTPRPALVGPMYVSAPALPAPKIETSHSPTDEPSFQHFVLQVQAGDVRAAGRTLAVLFALPESRALMCAATFAERWRRDPDFITRAMQLRTEVTSGSYNGSLVLLFECFGLTGIESIGVLQTLQNRVDES